MPTTRTVAVYGNTLALAGIALALERRPGWKVITLDPDESLAGQLKGHLLNAIIFDQSQTDAQTILARAEQRRDLLAIGLEANSDRMLLWSGHSAHALAIQDLTQAIDALPDSIHQPSPRLSLIDQWQSIENRMTRGQKLAIAAAIVGLCVIGVFAWSSNIPGANVSLNGTAVASDTTMGTGPAFGVGIVLGGVLIGSWFYLRQVRKK